ncbi:MAG: ATP-binding protein [Novosphingobium sp.]
MQRFGLLHSPIEAASELLREFQLGPGVFDALLRFDCDWVAQFPDRDAVNCAQSLPLELFPDHARLLDVAALLRSGRPACVGLWGGPARGGRAAAAATAQAAGRPLRALAPIGENPAERFVRAIEVARALNAVLLIEVDAFGSGDAAWRAALAALSASAGADVILTGTTPSHPLELLQGRAAIDVHLAEPGLATRKAWWSNFEPGIAEHSGEAIAARYRFSPEQIAAATQSTQLLHPAETAEGRGKALADACRVVSIQRAAQFAQVIVPKRQPDQLILPPLLHRSVLEVAAFYRNMPAVDDGWGFGRMLSGAGTKVLMTGDSGTGKTAAAEVIAGQVAADQLLLKVNLAGVVSKWVGETERNLDAVFTHAEESHAALFFDEADALFAKRGEVERGADRYANLEVGFLLQRLEEFGGLAILASNHKDQLDDAFMRRFHVILHFPRPGIEERRALWKMAIPPEAPLDRQVDFAMLEQLDLTGAGIVNAARLAALLATGEGAAAIGMPHLITAVARQFQNEARLLTPAQLGDWAHLVASPP